MLGNLIGPNRVWPHITNKKPDRIRTTRRNPVESRRFYGKVLHRYRFPEIFGIEVVHRMPFLGRMEDVQIIPMVDLFRFTTTGLVGKRQNVRFFQNELEPIVVVVPDLHERTVLSDSPQQPNPESFRIPLVRMDRCYLEPSRRSVRIPQILVKDDHPDPNGPCNLNGNHWKYLLKVCV